MHSFDDLALFVSIAEAGSLAAAARASGLPKSSVSRRLAALEARLGVTLLMRSTRRISLTESGRSLYESCRPAIAALLDAESVLSREPAEPHGRLRVTATGTFGLRVIGPLLSEFLMKHPQVSADLVLLDRPVDLIGEGFDLAVRMGPLGDSALKARRLTRIERVLCAAPAYLDRAGPLETLDDLKGHDAIVSIEGNRWTFAMGSRTRTLSPVGRLAGDQLETLRDAVTRGCGVAVLPGFLIADDLASGRLVRLLADTPPVAGAATALWPDSRNLASRTRAFIDFLVVELSTMQEVGAELLGEVE